MKPCYALLSNGQYVNLRHGTALLVRKRPNGCHVVIRIRGQVFSLYHWSAYPEPFTGGETSGESGNEAAAQEMLSRIMLYLAASEVASDWDGIIDMDDLAADVVADLGLEKVVS